MKKIHLMWWLKKEFAGVYDALGEWVLSNIDKLVFSAVTFVVVYVF